jgi:iron complex outermembrane receptor protein
MGDLTNTGISTVNAGAGASWIDDRGHLGGAYRYYANDYGIPGGFVGAHPSGVDIEMTRHALRGEGQLRNVGPFSRVDADVIHTRYNHRELEAGGILGTEYGLFTTAGEVQARHGGLGPATGGTLGARVQYERFGFGGSIGTPDSRRWTTSLYAFEEVELEWLTLEGGLRWDHVVADVLRPDPDASIGDVRDRSFDALSGSIGVLFQPASPLSVGATLARAFRAPDVNELYSTGPHLAAFVFEVGNPELETEVSTGIDLFARLDLADVKGEIALFHNAIEGYVYARDTGEISRVRLPVWQFTGADVRMFGAEAQLSAALTDRLLLETTASYVRGTLTNTDEPLPLIPPLNGRVGARYERTDWFAGAELRWADRQDRLGAFETPTAGYAVWGLTAGYRTTIAGRLHTLTLRLDNLGDTAYRNHIARTKEFMPEAGRGLSLIYRVVY